MKRVSSTLKSPERRSKRECRENLSIGRKQSLDSTEDHLDILDTEEATNRLSRAYHPFAHELIDEALRCFTDERKIMTSSRRECHVETAHFQHTCVIRVGGLKWLSHREDARDRLRYWDFASAARALGAAYTSMKCYPPRDDKECFHEHSVDLLGWLQTKAWSEIRSNVYRCLGSVFAAELVDRIFDYALVAECITEQPGTQLIDVEAEARGWDATSTKEIYRCGNMRYGNQSESPFGSSLNSEDEYDDGPLDYE
ncbi:hypothetical protein LTR37_020403 [Vermiconidia calcicola]|uniref:Uncharacterized protein n=1 Tax=Vermiconidia calcicola TaxID=1690605 RepID=A0ACC3MBF1_9PEZI|nr:hypothetical protein LTR37_020403 [Vermiconidia calcicola]